MEVSIVPLDWSDKEAVKFVSALAFKHADFVTIDDAPKPVTRFLQSIKEYTPAYVVKSTAGFLGAFWVDYVTHGVGLLHFAFVPKGVKTIDSVISFCWDVLALRKIEVLQPLLKAKKGKALTMEKRLKVQNGFKKQGIKVAHLFVGGKAVDLVELYLLKKEAK